MQGFWIREIALPQDFSKKEMVRNTHFEEKSRVLKGVGFLG
jgi:hypothetical protein